MGALPDWLRALADGGVFVAGWVLGSAWALVFIVAALRRLGRERRDDDRERP